MAQTRGPHAGREEEIFEFTPEAEPPLASTEGSVTAATAQARDGAPGKASKRRKEYEHLGSAAHGHRAIETPEQRLDRLRAEIAELIWAVEAAAANGPGDRPDLDFQGKDPAAMAEDLRTLEVRLRSVERDGPQWRTAAASSQRPSEDAATGRGVMSASLASQLEKLAAGGRTTGLAGTGKDGRVTYELSYAPVPGPTTDASKVAALEAGIAAAEQQLGIFDQACPFTDLESAVAQLQRRLVTLDRIKLDSVKNGIKQTVSEIDAVLAKRQELDGIDADQDLDKKVDELYEFCHKWSAVAPSLPSVVGRLHSLQALHQQSHSFAARLQALEKQQDELANMLEATNSAVQDLGKGLQENVQAMTQLMKGLEAKITKAARA